MILLVALTAGLLQEFVLCHADHNRQRIKGFYDEQRDSLDLVLLGASEVYSDFAPGYAYEYGGITGYLFATQADTIVNYKSQLRNILSRQKPSLIVIELNGALYGDEAEIKKEANLRNYADNVPLDAVKLDWLSSDVVENRLEYILPVIKYHGVWQDIPENMKYQRTVISDRLRGYCYLKGVLNETSVFKSTQRSMNSVLPTLADNRQPLTGLEESGLRDLLGFCRSEGLDNVVFARFPHIVVQRTYDRFERSNTVGDIVREYGYDYLNFERDFAQTGLDESSDFYNLDHLNIYGQRKFTAFLTDHLKERYSLSPREQSGSVKAEWDICADYYEAYYKYSDALIKRGESRELSEDIELIEELGKLVAESR